MGWPKGNVPHNKGVSKFTEDEQKLRKSDRHTPESRHRYSQKRRGVTENIDAQREFIAWDTEGVNSCGISEDGKGCAPDGKHHVQGCHKLVLLMNNKGDKLVDENGLKAVDMLNFLCTAKQVYPGAIHIIFGGSYDVNMILRSVYDRKMNLIGMPYKHVKLLQKNNRVFWNRFNISYVPRKYFIVSRYPKWTGDKRKRKPEATITIYDVVGFHQGSFVKTLKDYFKTDEERAELQLEKIEAGKLRRSTFSKEELYNFIIPYCQAECEALVKYANRLRDNNEEAGMYLKRWDGAGAAAAAVLQSEKVKQYYPVNTLTEVEEVSQIAYGGGHVEMYKYGHTEEPVYHYDVIGAYPSVMPLLVNLSNGEWIHSNNIDFDQLFTLYKVYWDYRGKLNRDGITREDTGNVMFPFFYRRPWSEPRVYYPEQGYSWVWSPEVAVALKYKEQLGGELKLLEQYKFIPGDDIKPFQFVRELYLKRLEYKRLGMGAALSQKLAINSFYGKMAQTVGYDNESTHYSEQRKPPYYNLQYAGMVTSYIRARMMDAMLQKPKSIIAVATDGLWSQAPLDLDIGEDLGQWEFELLSSMTSVQAGVYFATTSKGEKVYHYRGFNQGSISEDDIIQKWKGAEYSIKVPTKRFVTMGTAVASEERLKNKWCLWEYSDRSLEIFPGPSQKRTGQYISDGVPDPRAATQLLDTTVNIPTRFTTKAITFDNITEEYLSRKHPLPWDSEPKTEIEKKRDEDEKFQWEVTESFL